ncbi:hypothetical protein CSC81_12075 [Tenacibaculum discolor]|uniref:Uncharacterized protein n=2 Tax=Tenacibaculum TaxID=104267 RepID=A0A2G1BSV7_9FLAO|nr:MULTISPECIES: hypothetical protein [Tenacibaculum]MDE1205936.1 hypothetical protein [Tenacibaculum larymnensis]MDP2542480.1 hypothetical protein [Tenacibaculum discolor]PHN97140.1 hypothetical protein CSC81_12075 [Tenacibaculum discolor]PHO00352.1 hypothetical protein CSC82_29285 [Rhodobacteraceae bacterium 4F10]
MEKSIEKRWNEAFVNEQSLIAPKINDIYNQKSKSVINKIRRTYEFDNKGLLPMAGIVVIGGILLSETIIAAYGAFLILSLYFFNTRLLKRFKTIDVKSDNLTYLKNYRSVINSVSKATKKLFIFAIPLAIVSIFALAYGVKEQSFLSNYISSETSFIGILSVGLMVAIATAMIGYFVYTISTKVLYHSLISKLDDIIKELEELKNS